MPSRASVLAIVALAALPCAASANLDDTSRAAKARAAAYADQFGARDPIIKANGKGLVVMECWAAPPDQWPKETAMALALALIPARLRSETPKAMPEDGANETYVFTDGTKVILQNAGGEYIGVEVRAKGYNGPEC